MKHIRDCIRAFLVKRYGVEYWKQLRSQQPPQQGRDQHPGREHARRERAK